MTILDILLQIVLGIVSILAVLYLESKTRPKLLILLGENHSIPADDKINRPPTTWLRLRIQNLSMPKSIRWAYDKQPALNCRATIDFINPDGNQVFSIPGRWSGNPPPHILTVKTIDGGFAQTIIGEQTTIDIGPISEIYNGELLDIASRIKDDEFCYPWNNQNYLHDWRMPEHMLYSGDWKILAKIDTGGRIFSKYFLLHIGKEYEDFYLEELKPDK